MTEEATGRIRIAIAGYGNLGRGVEIAIHNAPDMTLVGVYTRRPPEQVAPHFGTTAVASVDDLGAEPIDVLILCGGSKEDLPRQGPAFAARFHTVDSFDTHMKIPEYFAAVDAAARKSGHLALVSVGWDPGLFSLNRMLAESLLPDGDTYTFWGDGLSQGHSDAIRRVPGVAGGVQYTRPKKEALDAVRSGARPALATRDGHWRECFVVLKEGADPEAVRRQIVTMPGYFADYDTVVHFISAEELARDHRSMAHGGFVIRSGHTTPEHGAVAEYRLKLDSNPEFTASVLVAYARALHRLAQGGETGARTVFDIAPGLLSPKSPEELRRRLL